MLFGSGELSPTGRKVYDWLLRRLPPPIQISILETPAGFELNSAQVAGRVADFWRKRLQNYHPQVEVVAARKRGTPFSPDNPEIVSPLLGSNVIFMGPGSPTYATRQLRDSLTWHTLVARHRLGAAIVMASAATVAVSAHALPVYEIYKVGEDLHWKPGLDFFSAFGLSLVLVPHWNNSEGGADLDTSRCFMGRARFEQLLAQLPAETTVIGLDEHTALVICLPDNTCQVMGRGSVTLLKDGQELQINSGQEFAITDLGPFQIPKPSAGLPVNVWEQVQAAQPREEEATAPEPTAHVLTLLKQRETARARQNWAAADALRDQIAAFGWAILDTPQGPKLMPESKTDETD